ncbi:MAG: TlpA family protein disulfide reductase, partial [Dehalococcoidia bacterium]
MPEAPSTDERDTGALDERPQRRREWSGAMRSVALPLLAVAAIVGAVWYLQGGRSAGATKTGAGLGVLPLDSARNHSGKSASAEKGRAAPDFRLLTLDGRTVRLSDLQGKIVLINFWATWCLPCRQEMPEIVKAYAKYHDRGFEVMSVDEQEDDATVQKWVTEFGMQFPVAMDRTGQVGLTFRAGTQFPTSLYIDPRGIVTDIKYGPMNQQFIE